MRKYTLALLVVTILILPLSLRACDCNDDIDVGSGIVHFKDSTTSSTPVGLDYGTGDNEGGCTCASHYAFRDYGSARVVVPPAPVTPRHPAS